MSKPLLLGIDLGTTNTSCSFAEYLEDGSLGPIGSVEIRQLLNDPTLEVAFGVQPVLPSVIYLKEDGTLFTGLYCKIAAPDLIANGGTIIRDIKRQIANPTWHVIIGERRLRPRHISALLLRTVKRSIEQSFNDAEVIRVVLTIPASFSSLMRQETLRAATLAGFDENTIELLDEPVAALLSGIANPNAALSNEPEEVDILIFDMGGGTLDASIVRVSSSSKKVDILSTSRYHDFAGNDIDLELAALLLQKLRPNPEYNNFLELDPEDSEHRRTAMQIGHGLLAIGERLKLSLSQALQQGPQVGGIRAKSEYFRQTLKTIRVDLNLDFSVEPKPTAMSISVLELIACLEPYMTPGGQQDHDIFVPIYQALQRAGVARPSHVYLAGGSSYFPLVQDAIGGYFFCSPKMLDPVFAVSHGAVVWAQMKVSGQWQITETMRDGIFLKRRGHSFLEVFSHPAPIPSQKQEKAFNSEECPYFSEGGNRIRLEFFQGDSPHDPLLSLCHVENLEFERELGEDSRLTKVTSYIDANKVFHFELLFQDHAGDIIQSVFFQPGRSRSDDWREEDSKILAGLYLNGEVI